MPTVIDAAGIKPPVMSGRSLRPVLGGDVPDDWRKLLFTEYTAHAPEHFAPRRTVRDERFKLIHNLLPDHPNPVPYQGSTRPGRGNQLDPAFEAAYRTMEKPPEWELYDLVSDPFELTNLIDEPAKQEEVGRLKAGLLAWREETNDPLLDPDELLRLKTSRSKKHEKK